MRVLLISAEYPPMEGGVGDYTRRLGLALRDQGMEVFLLTSEGGKGFLEDALPVFPWIRNWGWSCLKAIARLVGEVRPDTLHVQYQTGAYGMRPAIHFLPDRLKRLPMHVPLVVTMHDLHLPYLFPKAGPLRHAIVAHLLRGADAVVVTNAADLVRLQGVRSSARGSSPIWLRPLSSGTLRRPPELIPLGSSLPADLPGYDRAAWRARLGVAPDQALLGYFGLLHPSKGADLLVEAAARAREYFGLPLRLLFVGGGTGATDPGNRVFLEALRTRIRALGLEAAVLWSGPCAAEEAAAHLRACDLVVLPYRDGASFRRSSLIAALALGCPVLTTEPLEAEEVSLGHGQGDLRDGENVALVERGNALALAEGIIRWLADPQGRARLAAGAARLGRPFRWPEVAARVCALYSRLR
ncbi:MAG: glycosyltransferase [Chloroflexia bacterium]